MKSSIAVKRLCHQLVVLFLVLLLAACGTAKRQILEDERDYQRAFNDVYFGGRAQMEAPVKYGRVDLVSSDYAIEVDRLENFHEAIGQALHYAKETGKKPAVAFFVMDEQQGYRDKLKYVTWLCNYYKIKVWFINDELEKARKN